MTSRLDGRMKLLMRYPCRKRWFGEGPAGILSVTPMWLWCRAGRNFERIHGGMLFVKDVLVPPSRESEREGGGGRRRRRASLVEDG